MSQSDDLEQLRRRVARGDNDAAFRLVRMIMDCGNERVSDTEATRIVRDVLTESQRMEVFRNSLDSLNPEQRFEYALSMCKGMTPSARICHALAITTETHTEAEELLRAAFRRMLVQPAACSALLHSLLTEFMLVNGGPAFISAIAQHSTTLLGLATQSNTTHAIPETL